MTIENKNRKSRRKTNLLSEPPVSIDKRKLPLEVSQVIEEIIPKDELTLRQKSVEIQKKCMDLNLPIPTQATIYRFISITQVRPKRKSKQKSRFKKG